MVSDYQCVMRVAVASSRWRSTLLLRTISSYPKMLIGTNILFSYGKSGQFGPIWLGPRHSYTKKSPAQSAELQFVAEREGFEPPDPLRSTVFKTAAFDHSAISPKSNVISLHVTFSVKWTAKISTFFEIASGWEEKA